MLYLITGANGAGKTLNTLKWVRERSVKENRPVCHNGRFEPVEGGELSSWKHIDFKDWQSEPDGTIFLVDECHNDLPVRQASSTPPEHVRMLAEHRRRGFDFYLVTQHPQNIDSFVRRLIGSPGWHRHLKRTFGADLVSCIEWSSVNPNCEKDGASRSGTATMVRFPKEVYGWYRSASLHTGKRRIPKQVWILVACALAAPVLGYYGFQRVTRSESATVSPPTIKASSDAGDMRQGPPSRAVMTGPEYVASFKPRLQDFPHTSPRYDDVTKAVIAPYPAACVSMPSQGCHCYTQQGTKMFVSADVCSQIVKHGYFVDWQMPQDRSAPMPRLDERPRSQQPLQQPLQPPVQVVQLAPPPAQVQQPRPLDPYSQGLAARNSQVRSVFDR